jgi:hypothetical protein
MDKSFFAVSNRKQMPFKNIKERTSSKINSGIKHGRKHCPDGAFSFLAPVVSAIMV